MTHKRGAVEGQETCPCVFPAAFCLAHCTSTHVPWCRTAPKLDKQTQLLSIERSHAEENDWRAARR
ncbi:hypothetical protein KQH31_30690, partial [Streptomyces sp. CHA15]|nr:hypothetical protein [Streptomyces sp. CHA15]